MKRPEVCVIGSISPSPVDGEGVKETGSPGVAPRPKNPRLPYDEEPLRAYIATGQSEVDARLDQMLPKNGSVLYEAIRYSLFAGGKRFRSHLCLAAAESVGVADSGYARRRALPFACAMELIHTYSLVHDDLPAMDNDDLRRGKPTNHKQYGEGTAILVGDALLTAAFSFMADPRISVPAQQRLAAIFEMASAAGMDGMVLGQFMDLQSEGKKAMDIKSLETIHRHKTGALITASVRVGGILGNASPNQLESLTWYGRHLGLAFQIMDDLLDVCGEASEMGKSVGQDLKKEKWTYPRLVGTEKAEEEAYSLATAAIEALNGFGSSADPLRWIAGYTLARRK